jgi:para-aminobenzoate synthetase component I
MVVQFYTGLMEHACFLSLWKNKQPRYKQMTSLQGMSSVYLNKKIVNREAIQQMNNWGREGKTFFFLIDFQMQNPVLLLLEDLAQEDVHYRMSGSDLKSNDSTEQVVQSINDGRRKEMVCEISDSTSKVIHLSHQGYSKNSYTRQFERVVSEIKAGNSFLVNLTCETPVTVNADLKELYHRVKAKYKLLYKNRFLVFSPETFVQIRDGIISSCPMKGTIDANLPNAGETLLHNPKEKAEHSTIVDLIRNDLSMVASEVQVKRFRYIDEVLTDRGKLLQTSSEITGVLAEDYASYIGDILFALLPAGSITGAPKKKTVEIIEATETYERGYYTGVFGIFDGRNLDSAVLIRFLEQTGQGLVYKSGGGITAFSNLEDEYEEMLKKIYVPLH